MQSLDLYLILTESFIPKTHVSAAITLQFRQDPLDIFSSIRSLEKWEVFPNSDWKENSVPPQPPSPALSLGSPEVPDSKIIPEILGISGQLKIGIGFN